MQKALVLVLTQDNSPKQQQSTAAASTAATNGGNTLSFIKKRDNIRILIMGWCFSSNFFNVMVTS